MFWNFCWVGCSLSHRNFHLSTTILSWPLVWFRCARQQTCFYTNGTWISLTQWWWSSIYRRLVGKLLSTRPDITFAVQQLSQFLSKPTICHHKAAHRVLHYLKHSPGQGLSSLAGLHLWNCTAMVIRIGLVVHSRGFIGGYCFFLGNSLITWCSKKQTTIACSSSEAKYATCELQWLQYILTDLQIECNKTPVLYCDSRSALHIAANPVFHERTKHLEIDCHVVREKLTNGVMKLLPLSSANQIADMFTKALLPQPFYHLLSKLRLLKHLPVFNLWGGNT